MTTEDELFSLWVKNPTGDDVKALLCLEFSPVLTREWHNVHIIDPQKRNDKRTPLAVLIALLTGRPIPPEYVLDERALMWGYDVPGLIDFTFTATCVERAPHGAQMIREAMWNGPISIRSDGYSFATFDSYLTEISMLPPVDTLMRFHVEGKILKNPQPKERTP
jgi:hypothetical protein